MKKLLKAKNISVTPFRLAVLAVFENANAAIDQKELEHALGTFDRITLYRTIKKFLACNMIHEIVMPGEERKMALCPKECSYKHEGHIHQHIHFKCTACNQVLCVETGQLPELKLAGFQISSLELQARGICNACN